MTFRQLTRSRYLNILGLSIGYTGIFLGLFLYAHETSYDSWQADSNRIYRVEQDLLNLNGRGEDMIGPFSPPALASAIAESSVSTEAVVRLSPPRPLSVKRDREIFTRIIRFADEGFFDFFSFPFLAGNPEDALSKPNNVVLTKPEAEFLFGSSDALGRTIALVQGDALIVSGILGDLPQQTHFELPGMIAPISSPLFSRLSIARTDTNTWMAATVLTYFRTRTPMSPDVLQEQIADIMASKSPLAKGSEPCGPNWPSPRIVPLDNIHLHPLAQRILSDTLRPYGDREFIHSILISAAGLMFICIVNFINIENSHLMSRSKEFAIRRILGASEKDLSISIFYDLMIISFISLILSIVIMTYIIPYYGKYVNIDFHRNVLLKYKFILYSVIVSITISIACSIIPAHIYSRLRPNVLLSKTSNKRYLISLIYRYIFLFIQFSIVIFLIISTIFLYRQTVHLQKLDRGVDFTGIFHIHGFRDQQNGLGTVRREVSKIPGLRVVSSIDTWLPPKSTSAATPVGLVAGDGSVTSFADAGGIDAHRLSVDPDFATLFDIVPLAGRWLSWDRGQDSLTFHGGMLRGAVVVNDQAARKLGFASPGDAIGRHLSVFTLSGPAELEIVGVAPNIDWGSGREGLSPLLYLHAPGSEAALLFEAESGQTETVRKRVSALLSDLEPAGTVTIEPLEERYRDLQRGERLRLHAFTAFSALSILIACTGLYGTTVFHVQKNAREVSLRKIFGAGHVQIFILLTSRYFYTILLSFVCGGMISYVYNTEWLSGFSSRIYVDLSPFIISIIIVLSISVATFWSLVWKAIHRPPVEMLRDE